MKDLNIAENIQEILLTSQESPNKVLLGKVVKVTPGKRHVWVESNFGLIRKSVDSL